MHAIDIQNQSLVWTEQPDPGPVGPDEVRIRVAWAGINRADLLQWAGKYPPPPGASSIIGLEVSGHISEIGTDVKKFSVGDPVCALLAGGGYAEQVVVSHHQVLPAPEGLTLREAAGLPEVFATAWLNLFMEGQLQPGEQVLLHAGASGVGTAAIQLCREFGNPCFVTAGSPEKLDACKRLGADAVWNRHDGSFVDAVKAWGGVDLILDPVAGDYIPQDQAVLKYGGRLVLIGVMGGRQAQLDMGLTLMKRQRIIGSTLRSRTSEEKGEILGALYEKVWPLLSDGRIKPLIHADWPIQKAEEALRYLESNNTTGKLVLKVNQSAVN